MHLSMLASARVILQAFPNWEKHYKGSQQHISASNKIVSIFPVNNSLTRDIYYNIADVCWLFLKLDFSLP